MDFFDNVVNKSNAIIKERLNNPFGAKARASADSNAEQEPVQKQHQSQQQQQQQEPSVNANEGGATPCLESTARQHLMGSRDSAASNDEAASQGDRNSQFAAMAADAEAVAQKAAKGAKNIGTFLFSMANKAGQTVSQTAKQVKQAVESTNILTDLTREQQEFVKQLGGSLQPGELPWDSCAHDESKCAYIREQILTLSQDKRNFVRNPPNDSEFKFEPQSCYPQALALIKEDPNLYKLRQELVPKLVNEDTFWCNYFYRVSMLKQMSEKGERAKQGWTSSRSSSGEGPDEVGANITPHGTIDEPLSPAYSSASNATNATYSASMAIDRQQQQQQQQQQQLEQQSFSLDKQVASSQSVDQQAYIDTTATSANEQQQSQQLESSETQKLFAEADDLKSKLRELNIGSFDNNDAERQDEDQQKWEEELERDLLEFEVVSGADVDAYDEETLQREIAQLNVDTNGNSKA